MPQFEKDFMEIEEIIKEIQKFIDLENEQSKKASATDEFANDVKRFAIMLGTVSNELYNQGVPDRVVEAILLKIVNERL